MSEQEKFNIFIIDIRKKIKYDKFISREGYKKLLKLITQYEIKNKK